MVRGAQAWSLFVLVCLLSIALKIFKWPHHYIRQIESTVLELSFENLIHVKVNTWASNTRRGRGWRFAAPLFSHTNPCDHFTRDGLSFVLSLIVIAISLWEILFLSRRSCQIHKGSLQFGWLLCGSWMWQRLPVVSVVTYLERRRCGDWWSLNVNFQRAWKNYSTVLVTEKNSTNTHVCVISPLMCCCTYVFEKWHPSCSFGLCLGIDMKKEKKKWE